MKFAKSIPQADLSVRSDYFAEGWKKLKEPSSLPLAVIVSLPLMIVCVMIYLFILANMNPKFVELPQNGEIHLTFRFEQILFFVIGMYVYLFVHEMTHAVFIPGFQNSDKTLWGIRAGFGFVYTAEPLSKWRFILISVMPYILLSLVTTVIASLMGIMNGYMAFVFLLNAAGSCIDFLNATLVLVQVPNHSTIVSNGNETYFSPDTLH